jgi:hypothetical protein
MTCLRCAATTTNGLALCDLCQRKAMADLDYLPTYFTNLTRWRPGRAGSRRIPGSVVLWDGEPQGSGDRVRDALDEFSNALSTWARMLADSRPIVRRPLELFDAVILDEGDLSDLDDSQTTRLLCGGFYKNLTSIATQDWAGEFVTELGRHEENLRTITEDVAPGWYAGTCRGCGYATFVIPGLTWVTCSFCGMTTYARDRLPIVLNEARGWVARPRQIADVIVALVDGEHSAKRVYDRIRQWASREMIEPVDSWGYDPRLGYANDKVMAHRYRLGDVLDLRESTRRSEVVAS